MTHFLNPTLPVSVSNLKPSSIYVDRVLSLVNKAFIDGGMPDNIRPALYDALYTVENASRVNGEKIFR